MGEVDEAAQARRKAEGVIRRWGKFRLTESAEARTGQMLVLAPWPRSVCASEDDEAGVEGLFETRG